MSRVSKADRPKGQSDRYRLEPYPALGATRLFAVVSWGAAGTHWLSKVLNAHPDVLCLHTTNNPWSRLSGMSRVDDATYMQIIAATGDGYRLAGDCHGIAPRSITKIKDKWKDSFKSAVVVRHPVPRVLSLWNLANKAGFHHYKLDYDYIRSVTPRALTWVKTEEHLFFVHSVRMNDNITLEREIGPTFRMEDLTSNQGEVRRLLRYLSGDELDYAEGLLDQVFFEKVISHRGDKAPNDPAAVFDMLPDWQKQIFSSVLKPKTRRIYEDLGYDLSFLE